MRAETLRYPRSKITRERSVGRAQAARTMALSLVIATEAALLLRARVVGPSLACWAASPRTCPAPRAAADLAATPEVVELLVHRMVQEGRLVKATMLPAFSHPAGVSRVPGGGKHVLGPGSGTLFESRAR